MTLTEIGHEFVLAFADDELCVGQNHAWWIAIGPFLEEDLAFTSIAQDELGHARSLYSLLSDDVDRLAYGRNGPEYRSAHITELRCHDWSWALVRHLLHDLAEQIRWSALIDSTWEDLGQTAERALGEEHFHLQHGSSLVDRLLSSDQGRQRLTPAILELAPLGREYFTGSDGSLMENGLISTPMVEQEQQWIDQTGDFFEQYDISIDFGSQAPTSGRSGIRSQDFAGLHDEMTAVFRIDPKAKW
ncbi:MAG: 1,2-phenylacetyl-CoA epoxidase subunit PaaC [Actinomycetota bacterium]|nr:1,2-phenylacetyl-CoA epoxidase subunit PaaC [Actinomycetota bacterium]